MPLCPSALACPTASVVTQPLKNQYRAYAAYLATVAGRAKLANDIRTENVTMDEARAALDDVTTPSTDTARQPERMFPAYSTFIRWFRAGFKVGGHLASLSLSPVCGGGIGVIGMVGWWAGGLAPTSSVRAQESQ